MKYAVALALATAALAGAMTITVEAPGVQTSTLPNLLVEPFDFAGIGNRYPITSGIGAIFSGGIVVAPDQYGGNYQTPYYAVGEESGTVDMLIQFASPQSYVGLYWGAGDPYNLLKFYSGSTLVASYTTAQAFAGLSAAYLGNPNTGQNVHEPYAFFNFTGATFTSMVASNGTGTGFEIDEFSLLAPHPEPVTTPEPQTWLLLAGGALLLAGRRVR